MSIQDYSLTYESLSLRTAPTRLLASATLSVYSARKLVAEPTPQRRLHRSYQHPVSELAIHPPLKEDLYVLLGDWGEDGTDIFEIMVNPLISWIWISGSTLLLGSVIVLWPSGRQKAGYSRDEANIAHGGEKDEDGPDEGG